MEGVEINSNEAPNFSRNGRYPGEGSRIGPAWREAWALLADGEWHSKVEIVSRLVERCEVAVVTASNLLLEARRAGVLESRRRFLANGGNAPSDYRIALR